MMKANDKIVNHKKFWEKSGKEGYSKIQFFNRAVGNWILERQWQTAIDMGKSLGLNAGSRIIELGCGGGDGAFSESVLADHFKHIDAFGYSESAILRAQSHSKSGKVTFFAEDIRNLVYEENDRWDGAFLMGFLHHVKPQAPEIISRLSKVCPRIIISDPNGDNIIRKLLELLPFYRKSGEDSFRLKALVDIFSSSGYQLKFIKRIIFIPAFIPGVFLLPLKKINNLIESNCFLSKLCGIYILAFELIN